VSPTACSKTTSPRLCHGEWTPTLLNDERRMSQPPGTPLEAPATEGGAPPQGHSRIHQAGLPGLHHPSATITPAVETMLPRKPLPCASYAPSSRNRWCHYDRDDRHDEALDSAVGSRRPTVDTHDLSSYRSGMAHTTPRADRQWGENRFKTCRAPLTLISNKTNQRPPHPSPHDGFSIPAGVPAGGSLMPTAPEASLAVGGNCLTAAASRERWYV
jgi:hypothetical protein